MWKGTRRAVPSLVFSRGGKLATKDGDGKGEAGKLDEGNIIWEGVDPFHRTDESL